MASLKSLWLLAAYAASAALAQSAIPVSSFCSTSTNVCAKINVPSSGQDTYFSISAPTSSGWAAVGMGEGMAGALIFLMYPNESGNNVTVSPRLGKGHIIPLFDDSIRITMLAGTGISGDTMTANFVCKNCRKWSGGELDVTSDSQGFIWAVGGSSQRISSNDKEQTIRQHSEKGQFSLDVAAATGGSGGNPFPTSSSGTPTSGNGGTNTGGVEKSTPTSAADKAIIAHGVLMSFSWILMFPFGAALIRMLRQPLIYHRIVQVTSFLLAVIAMALGMYSSGLNKTHYTRFHQYFGTILVALLLVQGALGQLHHMEFVKTGKRSTWSYGHIWLGRTVILCAIINGGIGLGIVNASAGQKAAYSIISIIVFVSYAAGYWWTQVRQPRAAIYGVSR